MPAMGASPSRVLLLILAVAAVVVGGLFLAFSDRAESGVTSGSEPVSKSTEDPLRDALEFGSEPESVRSDAPRTSAERTASTRTKRRIVVTGNVIDARTRAPVPDAEVRATAGPFPDAPLEHASARSDEQGRYAVELEVPAHLRGSNPWMVRVDAIDVRFRSAWEQLEESDFRPDPGDAARSVAVHDFFVEPLSGLRGRLVRESDGRPIAGGTATLVALEGPHKAPRLIVEAETDEEGRFLILVGSVEPGNLAVLGSAGGFLPKVLPVVLEPAHVGDAGTLARGEGVCIEGTVANSDGSRLLANHVYVRSSARDEVSFHAGTYEWAMRGEELVPHQSRVRIGASGEFRICGLSPEEYSLMAGFSFGCGFGSPAEARVRAPASGVRLEFDQCVFRIRALDAKTGSPVPGVGFRFDSPGMVCPDLDRVRVVLAQPGVEYPGRIVAEGYRSLPVILPALTACEVRELEFRIEPLATVVVTIVVLSPEGKPVVEVEGGMFRTGAGADDSDPPITFLHSSQDGRHELPSLAPGTYIVAIEPARRYGAVGATWLARELELEVREGTGPIEVRLEEGGLVSARVSKVGGESIEANTWLWHGTPEPSLVDWHDGSSGYMGWLPKESEARLVRPLRPGPWSFRFDAEGCVARDVVVQVVAGQTVPIEVELEPDSPR